MTGNWWGTPDPALIAALIDDFNDGSAAAPRVKFDPFRDGPAGALRSGIYAQAAPAKSFNPLSGAFALDLSSEEAVNWTATIRDGTGSTVRSFAAGPMTSFLMSWDGEDALGNPAPAGLYSYTVDALNPVSSIQAVPFAGSVFLNTVTDPVADIDSPTDGQMVAGDLLPIIGSAVAAGAFDHYELHWGRGAAPTSWFLITSSVGEKAGELLGTLNLAIVGSSEATVSLRLRVFNTEGDIATLTVTCSRLNLFSVALTQAVFSPNADGVKETTSLSASVTQAVEWTVSVLPPGGGAAVRSFAGSGTAILAAWDGKDGAAAAVPDGVYTFSVQATHAGSGVSDQDSSRTAAVDVTMPTAQITAPGPASEIFNDAAVTGTASDANLQSFQLAHGAGTSPSVWTTFVTSFVDVTGGPLGTWETRPLADGLYSLRLLVTDLGGNISSLVIPVTIDNMITAVSASPAAIDPLLGQSSLIGYALSRPAEVTIRVYDAPTKTLARMLLSAAARSAGPQSEPWSGLSGSATLVPPEAYFFTIEAVDSSGKTRSWNDAAAPIMGPTPETVNDAISATAFDPYRNDLVTIAFDFTAHGRMASLDITPGLIRRLLNNAALAAGPHVVAWDGRRDDGEFHLGPFNVFFGVPAALPANPILVRQQSLRIDNLRADAYLILPVFAQTSAIRYDLTRPATVTITIRDPNGNHFRTLAGGQAQAAGARLVEWDGANDAGLLATLEGDYAVQVHAVDAATGLSTQRTGVVVVYR